MKNISILGCGWLGLPLAKSLLEKGFSVKGSTTSAEKINLLENHGIQVFQISLSEEKIIGEIKLFLENSEILIIDIPPKLRGNSKENFVAKIHNLIPFIENATIEKVLFVSSTSVYADDNSTVNETTKPQPDTESGKQLLETEMILQNNKNFNTTVVRFGGLIGENRHPIHFLTGRQHVENPYASINLIHQTDCIGILESIIDKDCFGQIFNAVAPFHPSRKDYYTQKATEFGLAIPEFDTNIPSVGKSINSIKVDSLLNYTFRQPYL